MIKQLDTSNVKNFLIVFPHFFLFGSNRLLYL